MYQEALAIAVGVTAEAVPQLGSLSPVHLHCLIGEGHLLEAGANQDRGRDHLPEAEACQGLGECPLLKAEAHQGLEAGAEQIQCRDRGQGHHQSRNLQSV